MSGAELWPLAKKNAAAQSLSIAIITWGTKQAYVQWRPSSYLYWGNLQHSFAPIADTWKNATQLRQEAEHLREKFDSASDTAKQRIRQRLHEIMQQMDRLKK